MRKKTFTTLMIAPLFLIILSSCGSEVKSDAKKAAKLACKAQKMATEIDLSNTEELLELQQEATSLYQELAGKYQNASDMEKFTDAYQEELKNCK